MPSEVVSLMRAFKRDIARAGSLQAQEMSRRWLAVERRLMGQIEALAMDMIARQASGIPVSANMLLNDVRYRELLIQLTAEQAKYTAYAEATITDGQRAMASAGITQSQQAIAAQVSTTFNRLPVSAVEHMVGLTGAGTPLNSILVQSWPLSAQGLTQALVDGVALGWGPRKTAKMMAEGMTGTLNRMLTIARTEQLRTYRESSIASYKESGIVTGYRRLCAHDRRTCAACIMSEGQFYDLDEEMPEHPNGRCAMIPVVKGVPPVQWLKGEEWFEQQDAATQQDILGKGHYDGWKAGQFALQDVVKVTPNSTWGPSLGVTPLRDLGGQAGRVALPSLPPAPIPQVQPVSSRLQFRSVPEGLLRSYGYDASTATQQQKLLDAVDTLAQPIQSMWKGGDVILAISPNPYTATHQSKWIIMGESSMNVPETLQHEFIHHILEQQQFREALPGFRPSTTLFRHAAEGADSLNEEMTMVLTKYHLERETWVRNLVNESWDVLNNGQPVTPEVARDKARDVADFLRTLGVEL